MDMIYARGAIVWSASLDTEESHPDVDTASGSNDSTITDFEPKKPETQRIEITQTNSN
jgi:hypothetical protein